MTLKTALDWLVKHWWGLLVAYVISLGVSYSLILAKFELFGVPNNFTLPWPLFTQRSTYHIIGSFLLGTHIALVLELIFRRFYWKIKTEFSESLPFDKGYAVAESKYFYDSIAGQYDQRNSPSLLRTHELVIRSIKNTVVGRKDVCVLDLGGGTGKLIAHHFFDNAEIHWIYVDESALMVEQFRRNLESTNLNKSVEVEEISLYLQRHSSRFYDIVLMSLVLTSMERNPDWTLIASRLKPDGRLIIADIDAAYTVTHPYYIVSSGVLRHALRPRAVALTQIIHETRIAGLKLEHSYPIPEGGLNYAFVAEFSKI